MISAGQVLVFEEEDWDFRPGPGKQQPALNGLACDRHVKRKYLPPGAVVGPEFGPYDYIMDGGNTYVDIKTYTRGWVSISEGEHDFLEQKVLEGFKFLYQLFKQIGDEGAKFECWVDAGELLKLDEIIPSHYSGWTISPYTIKSHGYIFLE